MTTSFQLKPHQKKAVEEIRNGSIVCGGTGTGKSITALAYFYVRVCHAVEWADGGYGPMTEPMDLYIITTATKRNKGEWEKECERFDFEGIKIVVDSWNNCHKYIGVRNAFFIFDEQRVCGKGKWVKSFWKITRWNQWILLSATPGDKWTDYMPVFVANGFYENQTDFARQHIIYSPYVTKYPKIVGFRNKRLLEKRRRDITVLMEFQKATVPHWEDVIVSYDKEKYNYIYKNRMDPWEEEPIEEISKCCYLLRKATNKLDIPVMHNYEKYTVDHRANVIFWMINTEHISPKKFIVFYNFDYERDAIIDTLVKQREMVSGGVQFIIAEWNGHKHEPVPICDSWIYLVQYSAGAEGWNCIETNTIIFYSMTYSYKQLMQAAGRIDRLNTDFIDLYYYILKSESPIDKAIEKALQSKKDFNEGIFWYENSIV